ncbi:hypothetical protein [Umezawaea sp. Da 62-37]|uniref:hypothetical protein n=1 Tax=Umezawaea sp. Da 62-37 TaxID=3075927 RepID=UPI0028F6E870|nr:hypothetical protein [Umezawaea sp. Da 62-37]WNV86871.1 hypothetical protein RM788_00865 [Umezawaea sp. Da 62-37]
METHDKPDTRQAFGTVKLLVAAYGAVSAAVFTAVVVLSITGHAVTSFMWGRASGVLASAAVTYWLVTLAARGSRSAYVRVRIISVVVPIAIIVIDLVADGLPTWFVVVQVACALAVGATAFIVNGSRLRGAFPKAV